MKQYIEDSGIDYEDSHKLMINNGSFNLD